MKFYVATGKTKAKLMELYRAAVSAVARRNKFVKRHKAKGHVSKGHEMVGLVFKGPPVSPWRAVKSDVDGHAAPDRTKAGKVLRDEMDGMKKYSWLDVATAIGVVGWHPGTFSIPDFRVYGQTVVFGCDDRDTPNKDCGRISDVQYEAMVAKEKAKAKAGKR